MVDRFPTAVRSSAAVLLLAAAVAAQARPATTPVERRARSLTNQLELAERRDAAVDELLGLGADAVPALAARLGDPRPEVVQVVCQVLCALGTTAQGALPQLATAAASRDAAIVRMARMTELAVRPTGVTTICEDTVHRVVQLEADGKERELAKGVQAWDAEPLPGGHLLLTLYRQHKVVELDADGNEVWSFDELKNPYDADRLLDGNTLISDGGGQRIIEVDPAGSVVWEFKHPPCNGCFDVDRLPNGNTLMALYPDVVLEVDRTGEVVWQLKEQSGVIDADRLPNGNTLLTLQQSGAVRELNKKGEVVWELNNLNHPNDADRLPDGNTLVATTDSVIEFKPDRRELKVLKRGKRVTEVVRR
ncbi:MAG TPA: PQQ-binding-like beta-propeller repeat protein [Planctomycetota bacterium]